MSVHVCHLGYVDNIKERLVCMTKEEREKIQEKYKDKVPEPLTSQFLEKTPKNEAIKSYKERKAKTAELFPTGECKPKIEFIINAIGTGSYNFLTYFLLFLALEQTALMQAEKRKLAADPQPAKRRARQCTKCKASMKGHPRSHCPQNLPQP